MFVLECQKSGNVFWSPYISTLPTKISNFPIFFNKYELNLLSGSYFFNYVETMKKQISGEYILLTEINGGIISFSFQEYLTTKVILSSRIFSLKIKNNDEKVLIPYADMINFDITKIGQTFWHFDENMQEFVLKANKNIKKFEYLSENYGLKSNLRLFINYGYTLKDNPIHEFYFDLCLDSEDPLILLKQEFFNITTLKIASLCFSLEDPKNYEKVFCVIRMIEFIGNSIDFNQMIKAYLVEENNCKGLKYNSINNEIKMHKKMIQICQEYKIVMLTNSQKIDNIKSNFDLIDSENISNISKYFESEIEGINLIIEFSNQAIDLLKSDYIKAFKYINEIRRKKSYSGYF